MSFIGGSSRRTPVRARSYLVAYALLAIVLLTIHAPLLRLPYYWDELGQYVPASLDLFGKGLWIPRSTLPNVHPPGVMAYLAGFWHVFGYSISATRIAMLLVAAAGALVVFLLAIELSRSVPGTPAFAAVALLCVCPLFVAQSMLVQLDMPAMCGSMLALLLFLQNRFRLSALVCVLLVLTKETGIVAPALFGTWLLAERRIAKAAWYLLPLIALCLWLGLLKQATGHWFGNREFTQYNLYYPLNPVRFTFALLRRGYFLFLATGHIIGLVTFLAAYRRFPLFRDRPWQIAGAFLALHTIAVTALGGAVLERYLLPVLPIVYIAFAISFRAFAPRVQTWTLAALLVCLALGNFLNPIYPFPFENNLEFTSFVDLQQDAAAQAELMPGTLAAAFPMADAFRRPEYGYVARPRRVREIQGFRASDVEALKANPPDLLIVQQTEWDPFGITQNPLSRWLLRGFYDYARPLGPDEIARRLGMRVNRTWRRRGLFVALLVRQDRQ